MEEFLHLILYQFTLKASKLFTKLLVSKHEVRDLLDGWMTCDFTSFSTVFQLYQDDGRLIMIGCVHWSSVYGREDFASSGDRTRSARSEGQHLTH